MMSLQVTNTLTSRKEPFVSQEAGRAGVYVCGPTVYDHAHLGHAKSYVSFDVIVRTLRFLGYRVRYVQNITDVGHLTDNADEGEDKILKRASLERLEPMEIAEKYARSFFEDMDALGNVRPDISPRASGHIPEQIELVKTLLDKGHAYVSEGSVYFSVATFPAYGRLTGRNPDEMRLVSRLDENAEKRAPHDFALWKRAHSGHLMQWSSPWGIGYPGWHLECSAMAMKYLGKTVDIHGGGLENAFPHHECEIAQSEAATGQPFVRHWLHNNMVTVDGTKMGKSLGNFVTLKQIFQRHHPQHVRMLILGSHYRHPLDFSDMALEGAARGYERLVTGWTEASRRAQAGQIDLAVPVAPPRADSPVFDLWEEAVSAMEDDFNTPRALAALFDLAKRVNIAAAEQNASFSFQDALLLFEALGSNVLGLQRVETDVKGRTEDLVRLLIDVRSDLREKKLWAASDAIRDRLSQLGFLLEDTQEGTRFTLINNG